MADLWDTAAFGVGSPAETANAPSGMNNLVGGLYNYFGGLAKRSIENSQTSLDTGTYDPRTPIEAAMLPMGTGAITGVPVRGTEAVLGAGPIRAYHGSPHDFDAFDLSKIGTGEGAQAYGHGLYFAENEGVAKAYQDALKGKPQSIPSDPDSPIFQQALRENIAANELQVASGDLAKAKAGLNSKISGQAPGRAREDYEAALDMLHDNPAKFNGRMYEVNINADPEHFLDWDKPLSQQHPVVQEAANRDLAAGDAMDLRNYVRSGGDKELAGSGIPGIRYLDQGSRAAGDGSRNYVVFNDKLIDIMRKYGVLLPGGIAAADAYRHQTIE